MHLGQECLSNQGLERLVLDLHFGNAAIPRQSGRPLDNRRDRLLSVILRRNSFWVQTADPKPAVLSLKFCGFRNSFRAENWDMGDRYFFFFFSFSSPPPLPFSGLGLPCSCFGTVELLRGQDAILTRNPPGYLSLPGILLETCAVLPVEWTTVWGTQISNACVVCSGQKEQLVY